MFRAFTDLSTAPTGPATPPARPARRSAIAGALLLTTLLAGGCADLHRDGSGSPPLARLAPNAIPPAPITPEERQKLGALNQQVLREQEAAIRQQQAAEAYARASAYAYPAPSWSLYYGGWGGGHWGGGVGFATPGWGWGYPYWW